MTRTSSVDESSAPSALRSLFGELGDLKRIRSAGRPGSIAERGFSAAWSALCAGKAVREVMRGSVAAALAAARLGDLDIGALTGLGLDQGEALVVLRRGFDAVSAAIDPASARELRDALGAPLVPGNIPPFVGALAAQPRAGATCPGKPRILLEPPENHAEHCWAVAVFGVLLAPSYDANPIPVFLAGLSHHFHNAVMPDSGFTGEILLGDELHAVCAHATDLALAQLEPVLRAEVEAARRILADADSPEGRAFHAADVVDRVMQVAQHLRVTDLTMPMLLDEWQLVHAGPVKAFHDEVLAGMALP